MQNSWCGSSAFATCLHVFRCYKMSSDVTGLNWSTLCNAVHFKYVLFLQLKLAPPSGHPTASSADRCRRPMWIHSSSLFYPAVPSARRPGLVHIPTVKTECLQKLHQLVTLSCTLQVSSSCAFFLSSSAASVFESNDAHLFSIFFNSFDSTLDPGVLLGFQSGIRFLHRGTSISFCL